MKSLFKNLLLLMSVFSLVFLFSCGDDDTEEEFDSPTVTVDIKVNGTSATSPAIVNVGDKITADLDITASGGFNAFRVTLIQDGSSFAIFDFSSANFTIEQLNSGEATIMTVPDSLENTSFTMEFLVVDDLDQQGTALSFDINVAQGIETHTNILLGGPLNSATGSFYDAVADSVYLAKDAFQTESQSNIDFVFWFGTESQYAIGATDDATAETAFESQAAIMLENLKVRNETRFKYIGDGNSGKAEDFDAVKTQSDLLEMAGETGITDTNVIKLSAGSVFAIKLDDDRDGKIGLVKVIGVSGGSGTNRFITIEVKIQK